MSDKIEDIIFIGSVLMWLGAYIVCLIGGLIC